MSWALTCTPSHAIDLFLVLGFDVYPIPRPRLCPWPFPEPRPMRPEFCSRSTQIIPILKIMRMDSQLTKLHPRFACWKKRYQWAPPCWPWAPPRDLGTLCFVLGFNVYPVPRPRPCPRPFPEPRPTRPEFCSRPENLAWVILDHARSQLKINVGRRGTKPALPLGAVPWRPC